MYVREKILIIEDNLLNQKIISFWLAMFNYTFSFASSGEEGLALFGSEWYDIVIMDLMLPGINGFETTRILRKTSEEKYQKQPFIVALTANTLDNDRLRCIQAGMDEYMAKPFDIQQLNNILADRFSN